MELDKIEANKLELLAEISGDWDEWAKLLNYYWMFYFSMFWTIVGETISIAGAIWVTGLFEIFYLIAMLWF